MRPSKIRRESGLSPLSTSKQAIIAGLQGRIRSGWGRYSSRTYDIWGSRHPQTLFVDVSSRVVQSEMEPPRPFGERGGHYAVVAELEALAGAQHPICNRENVGSSPTDRTTYSRDASVTERPVCSSKLTQCRFSAQGSFSHRNKMMIHFEDTAYFCRSKLSSTHFQSLA